MDIFRLADRVRKLTSDRQLNRDKAGLITFTFGAVYALGHASEHGGIRNRDGATDSWQDRIRDVKQLSGGMAVRQRMPTLDKHNMLWVAGFDLNNALVRIDVGFERVCRYWANIPANKNLDRRELERRAIAKNFDKSLLRPWEQLRSTEANLLKHHVSTLFTRPRMPYSDVLKCLASLIEAVEYCIKNRR